MEKNYNCLFEVHYQSLIQRIKIELRRAARAIPVFRDSKNGCIRITIVPLSTLADSWLGGGLSDFGEFPEVNIHDVCEQEFVYPIFPGGSHTIQWQDPKDGHIEPVNCYGYSALKTAWASKVRGWQNTDRPLEPGPASGYYVEENGWSTHEGSVWATVTLDGVEFLRLYVCTSGAKAEEDQQCSLTGMRAAQEFFRGAEKQIEETGYFQNGIPITVKFGFLPDFTEAEK